MKNIFLNSNISNTFFSDLFRVKNFSAKNALPILNPDHSSDPHEKNDISDDHVEIVKMGLSLLSMHNETAIAPQWPKLDPQSKPDYRKGPLQGFWWPWK